MVFLVTYMAECVTSVLEPKCTKLWFVTTQCKVGELKLKAQLFMCGNRGDKMELPFYGDDIKGMELYVLKRDNKYKPVRCGSWLFWG